MVDRTARGDIRSTHIIACFIDIDRDPALREINCEKGTGEAGSDDNYIRHRPFVTAPKE
jgi:hypothetical protein